MQKEIKINLKAGAVVLIPDSNTLIHSYSDHAIMVPAVAAESTGTSLKYAQILKDDFATHIHDLYSAPITVITKWTSGTTAGFNIFAEKRGKSDKGMSPWYVCTSNGWEIRLAEAVLEKRADLNQCMVALAVKAAGENFSLGSQERAIQVSIDTLKNV